MLGPRHRRSHVPGSATRPNVNPAVLEIRGVEVPGIIAAWLVTPRSRKAIERSAMNPIARADAVLPAVVADGVEPVCRIVIRAGYVTSKVPPRVRAFPR